MHKFAAAALVVLVLIVVSLVTHGESWLNRSFPGRSEELSFIHDQVADIFWVLVLCAFSILIRVRNRRPLRIYVMAAGIVLLTLAALHSHPLWSSRKALAGDVHPALRNLTRILGVESVTVDTGLGLGDIVTAMAFDPDGALWLATAAGGPYAYSVATNEVVNLMRPDFVYGLAADRDGMFVFASRGAFLYRGLQIIHSVRFPDGVIPLCGMRLGERYLFGTTRGLYATAGMEEQATHLALQDRVSALHLEKGGVLVSGDSGMYRWTDRGAALCRLIRHRTLTGMVGSSGSLYAPTSEDGILVLRPGPSREIRFAVPELNMISPGATVVHRSMPCFGTYDGSVVCERGGVWRKIRIGEFPVTALASDRDRLFAWSGGRLLEVEIDG